jgi:Signal peptidase, peptidase S26/Sigma-70 region 2
MNDDLDAIRRVLAADVESFRCLVERYRRPLLTLIRNLTPPDNDHEGVAQEVFLAAFRSLASFGLRRRCRTGMCFVLGDNRSNSRDSRTIGFVALGDVLGDVQYRYWPAAT